MCNFPNINYQQPFQPLNGQTIPKTVPTILINRGLISNDFLDGITSMSELEATINNAIASYNGTSDERLRIFHLIQIWGGNTGRYVYVKQHFDWTLIDPIYEQIINVCLGITNSSEVSQRTIYSTLINNRIRYVGISFITKHTRFWLHKNCGEDVLPIYDSVLASRVMHRGYPSWPTLIPYWSCMKLKSKMEKISLLKLERIIFNNA